MTESEYRRAAAFGNRMLHGLVGSTVHGLELAGQDDRDEMGVFIEPPESAVGLRPFEHWVERTQPEGVRSGPGDLDLTLRRGRRADRGGRGAPAGLRAGERRAGRRAHRALAGRCASRALARERGLAAPYGRRFSNQWWAYCSSLNGSTSR